MSDIKKKDLRVIASEIDNSNPMKFLIKNLVTRITRIGGRKSTVNLIEIRNVFFDHLKNIKDDKNKKELFIKTINNHFSKIAPTDMGVISEDLFEEWNKIKQKEIEGYSDFTLSREPPLREMGGEEKQSKPITVQSSHPPIMRQASISEPWDEILSGVFPTDESGPTRRSRESVIALLNRNHPPNTPLYRQKELNEQNIIAAANEAARLRYLEQGRPVRKPYSRNPRGGKTRKRKKMKRKKYKTRRRKQTKRKLRKRKLRKRKLRKTKKRK